MVSVMIWFSFLSQWEASIWVTWSVLTNQKPDRPIRGRQCDNRRDNDGQVEGEHLTLNTDHWAIVWGTLCDTKYPGSWRNFSQYSDVGSGSVSGSSSLSVIRIISIHRQLAAPCHLLRPLESVFVNIFQKLSCFRLLIDAVRVKISRIENSWRKSYITTLRAASNCQDFSKHAEYYGALDRCFCIKTARTFPNNSGRWSPEYYVTNNELITFAWN